MTEQWLKQDILRLIRHRNRLVILDPAGKCSFILPVLESLQIVVLSTDATLTQPWQQEREELFLRHDAETRHQNTPLAFYVTRPQEKLSFLFDYCFTHGCLDLSHPQDWLKKKLFAGTGLQVQLDNPMLLTVAKLGIGKELVWWKKIVQNLEEVINLEEELLPFLHNPETYMETKDADVRRLFEEKLHGLTGYPYVSKPAKTLADEVVKRLLDGLANNDISDSLLALYHKWADSTTYRPSLEPYIQQYQFNQDCNPWIAHPDHCFPQLDRLALVKITENIRDKSFVNEKLQILHQRINQSKARPFVPAWWKDVLVLFQTDVQPLSNCKNLPAVVDYYTTTFSKVDRAIRNLYEVFLSDETIIRPMQEYYEGLNSILLQTWYEFASEYQSDQQGYLPELFSKVTQKTAVIVGDGVRYEMAEFVAADLQKHFRVDRQIMMAGMPSETEHNMSALYVGDNQVLPIHRDREKGLTELTGKPIVYLSLDKVNYGLTADFLVLSYKDIDSVGEKLQLGAIKVFSEFETVLIEKIKLLLNLGYQDVYLVTDHGFVLTGLLEEADKIDPLPGPGKEVHERFIRTVDKLPSGDWLAFESRYAEFNYVYAARNHRPFRSKGAYGFSHGGFTPQEIIIPKFKFSKTVPPSSQLAVRITNKSDLQQSTGELFEIRLEATGSESDLFSSVRKLQIKLFAGSKEIQSTIFGRTG